MPSTSIPRVDPQLQAAIDASNMRHAFVAEYRLDQLVGHLQVRYDQTTDIDERLNAAKVREYVNKFKAGSIPPPIGVTRDNVLVWGNHRVGAAHQADVAAVPAIVFDVDGVSPDEHVSAVLRTMAGRENASHGLPLSNKDREMIVRLELQLGTTGGVIAATYGMTPAQISGLRREIEAEQRLDQHQLRDLLEGRTRGIIRALSGKYARILDDEPFVELVRLIADADLQAKEVNAIAAEAKATGSERGALGVLATKRGEMAQRVASFQATGVVERPTPRGKLLDAVRRVLALCEANPASHYRDYSAEVEETKAMVTQAINCLGCILEAQES